MTTATFVPRSVVSIASEMLATLSALTPINDLVEGAVGRTLMEAAAVQIQSVEVAMAVLVREGIITGTYQNFEFPPLPATYSSGLVRFTRPTADDPLIIPAGSRVAVPGSPERTYVVIADAPLLTHQFTTDVLVRCLTPGRAGNTAADTIVTLVDQIRVTPFTLTNPGALFNGLDAESESERFRRFKLFIAGLSRATAIALEGAARGVVLTDVQGQPIERVASVLIHEPWVQPTGYVGLVEVFVDNGAGTASPTLLDLVRQTLHGYLAQGGARHPGWVAAGVILDVQPVTPLIVDVLAAVQVKPGYDPAAVRAAAAAALTDYLGGLSVFAPAVLAELIAVIMDTPGVADVAIVRPIANVNTDFRSRIIPGQITVT